MQLSSRAKHLLHCCLCVGVILIVEVFTGGIHLWKFSYDEVDPVRQYGWPWTIFLYLMRLLTVLALPQCICNCLGLLLYNAFPEKVRLKGSPLLAPFVCIRVVTRGDYADLVRGNVARNIETCADVGLENFIVEVVTDKALGLAKHPRIREVVVPTTYRPKSGALFKARALQYCLEDDVNILSDDDWIVHLDEETLLTEDSVRGILNFAFDGRHAFGQGLITYANERVVNWVTTLADSFRVADDMGKLRFQFWAFHRPLFGWKGSYVVARAGAERRVSFDHGLDGSVAEDCFFSMVAFREGYTFDFIPGEMWEKSPFSFWDFLQQRKRWMQGIFLVVHSGAIPIRHKLPAVACALLVGHHPAQHVQPRARRALADSVPDPAQLPVCLCGCHEHLHVRLRSHQILQPVPPGPRALSALPSRGGVYHSFQRGHREHRRALGLLRPQVPFLRGCKAAGKPHQRLTPLVPYPRSNVHILLYLPLYLE
uniref:Putative beta-14-mannosyltransferase egh n=1 Tax=Ixodes ricinus TaxID=34613 RepID=V5GLU3_IXORI